MIGELENWEIEGIDVANKISRNKKSNHPRISRITELNIVPLFIMACVIIYIIFEHVITYFVTK